MIFLVNKKSILSLLLVITTGYLTYNFLYEDAKPTITLPITNKIIVIDAGHGGVDPGAIGDLGIFEKDINLDIVLKLQAFLEQSGCITVLTRAVDESIHDLDKKSIRNKKRSDLMNRKEIIDTSKADAYVSIHLNSFPESKYKGVQSFYSRDMPNSKGLAENIQKELKTSLKINDNRVALPISNVYLMKDNKIPSVIVECGFLSNSEEQNKLKTEEYRKKIAWGIYLGIMKYFEET